ncbi:MAG: substrate-binding domain-containing protein, partial [Finegoldia magna]|uniref:substrate-binding domain-containing protein n=1 Tax=Finegoldia magna TaxID=1260 RepID=UPI0039A2CAB0
MIYLKIKKFMLVAMMLVFGVFMVACAKQDDGKTSDNSSKTETTSTDSKSNESAGGEIHVVSRENGSGTRGAFTEITKILEKGADGKEQDKTAASAIVQNSTNAVMMTVGQDKDAIGYISLGSLNDKVNAVKINGVEATSENVQKGDYKISRPFNIAYKGELKPLPKDFLD